MKLPTKKSSIAAIIFWIVSFILSFTVPPSSQFIWLPDTLLLLGFWPLFFGMRARWWWLVFGICNMFIGFVLLVSIFLPDQDLARYNMLAMKTHMKLYHPYLVWFLIGLFSTIISLIVCIKSFSTWLYKRSKNSFKAN